MGDLILGVHVSQSSKVLDEKKHAKSMSQAIKRDTDALGLNACQIFTHGPRTISENKIDYDQVQEVCKDLDLTVHTAYATTGIWKVNNDNKTTSVSKKKLTQFKNQLDACKKTGGWGIVLHISKVLPELVVETMKILKPIIKKTGVKVLLEMVASKADDRTYETPEKLDNLITLLGINESYYGITVDTAHLWGAGVSIRTYSEFKDWLDRFVHKKKISQFHLNGSSAARGSGKDKHEIVFSSDDIIWHNVTPDQSGVKALVNFAKTHSIPIICEINRGNEEDVIKGLNAVKKLGGVYEN